MGPAMVNRARATWVEALYLFGPPALALLAVVVLVAKVTPAARFAVAELVETRPVQRGTATSGVWLGASAIAARQPVDGAPVHIASLDPWVSLSAAASPVEFDRVFARVEPILDGEKLSEWRWIDGADGEAVHGIDFDGGSCSGDTTARPAASARIDRILLKADQAAESGDLSVDLSDQELNAFGLAAIPGAGSPSAVCAPPYKVLRPALATGLLPALAGKAGPTAVSKRQVRVRLAAHQVPAMCLAYRESVQLDATAKRSGLRYVPLDPATGLIVRGPAGFALAFGAPALTESGDQAPSWWDCTTPTDPRQIRDGDVIGEFVVVQCPGFRSGWAGMQVAVSAGICVPGTGGSAQMCAAVWSMPAFGSGAQILLDRLKLVAQGSSVSVHAVAVDPGGAKDSVSPTGAQAERAAAFMTVQKRAVGEQKLPNDSSVLFSVGGSSAMYRLCLSGDRNKPVAKLEYLPESYSSNLPRFTRGVAFPSLQPGAWRYRPYRAAVALAPEQTDNVPALALPGIADLYLEGGHWHSASTHARPVVGGRNGRARFQTPEHLIEARIVNFGLWLEWIGLLAGVVVILFGAAVLAPERALRRFDSIPELAVAWLIVTGLAITATAGAIQVASLGVSPTGHNSTLYVARHLSSLVAGAFSGWLLVAIARRWLRWRKITWAGSPIVKRANAHDGAISCLEDDVMPSGAAKFRFYWTLLLALLVLVGLPWLDYAALLVGLFPQGGHGPELWALVGVTVGGAALLGVSSWRPKPWRNRMVLSLCLALLTWQLGAGVQWSPFVKVEVALEAAPKWAIVAGSAGTTLALALAFFAVLAILSEYWKKSGDCLNFAFVLNKRCFRRPELAPTSIGKFLAKRWKWVLEFFGDVIDTERKSISGQIQRIATYLQLLRRGWLVLGGLWIAGLCLGIGTRSAGFVAIVDGLTMVTAVGLAYPAIAIRRHIPEPDRDVVLGRLYDLFGMAAFIVTILGTMASDGGPMLVRNVPLFAGMLWTHLALSPAAYYLFPTILAGPVSVLLNMSWPASFVLIGSSAVLGAFLYRHSVRLSRYVPWRPLLITAGLSKAAAEILEQLSSKSTGGAFEGLADLGVDVQHLPLIGPGLQGMNTKVVERLNCRDAPQFWDYCGQLIEARRYQTSELGLTGLDSLVGSAHSDLAWAHTQHVLGPIPLLAATACALLAVLLLAAVLLIARQTPLRPTYLAAAIVAISLYVGYAGLHTAGSAGTLPLSGVPFPLLSYSVAGNTLLIITVFLGLGAMLGPVAGIDSDRARTPAPALACMALAAIYVLFVAEFTRPGHAAGAPQGPSSASFLDRVQDGQAKDLTLTLAKGPSNIDVCDDAVPIAGVGWHPATNEPQPHKAATVRAGPSGTSSDSLFRAVSSRGNTAVVRTGWLLDYGKDYSLCSDGTCDLVLGTAAGPSCTRVTLRASRPYSHGDGHPYLQVRSTQTSACAPVVSEPNGRAIAVKIRGGQGLPRSQVAPPWHISLPTERAGQFGRSGWGFEPRVYGSGVDAKVALCIVAGPHLVQPDGSQQPNSSANGDVREGLGHSDAVTLLPLPQAREVVQRVDGLKKGMVHVQIGLRTNEIPPEVQATETLASLWDLYEHGALKSEDGYSVIDLSEVALPPYCQPGKFCGGLSEDGLAGVLGRPSEGRRLVRSKVVETLERRNRQRMRIDRGIGQPGATKAGEVAPNPAEFLRPIPKAAAVLEPSAIPAASTPRVEASWWLDDQMVGAPLLFFLDTPAHGIGRSTKDALGESLVGQQRDVAMARWLPGRLSVDFAVGGGAGTGDGSKVRTVDIRAGDSAGMSAPEVEVAVRLAESASPHCAVSITSAGIGPGQQRVFRCHLPQGQGSEFLQLQFLGGHEPNSVAPWRHWGNGLTTATGRLLDLGRTAVVAAHKHSASCTIEAALQSAIGYIAHDWLSLAKADAKFYGARATVALIDYRTASILALVEAHTPVPAASTDGHLALSTPLFFDGQLEISSVRPPLAELDPGSGDRGGALAAVLGEVCGWTALSAKVGGLFVRRPLKTSQSQLDFLSVLPNAWAQACGSWTNQSRGHSVGARAGRASETVVHSAPYVVASVFAALARRVLPDALAHGDKRATTPSSPRRETAPSFRWLRIFGANPGQTATVLPSEVALSRFLESIVRKPMLNSPGGQILAAAWVDKQLGGTPNSVSSRISEPDALANEISYVFAPEMPTKAADEVMVAKCDRRRWSHFVSFVDPKHPLAGEHPLLIWVTVEVLGDSCGNLEYPEDLAAARLAGEVKKLLSSGWLDGN